MSASPPPPRPVATSPAALSRGHLLLRSWRFAVVLVLGFASGLPLALTGQALQAWLSVEGVDIATIGFLSLVGLPYTFKFLWAPLMDRFEPFVPWLGRRRGWLVITQLGLAGGLMGMAAFSPTGALQTFALLAVTVAFVSASHDVVIDAYRTDLLPPAERGMGSSLNVAGYRAAMVVSGGLAMIWTDPVQGGGLTWPEIYRWMALAMVVAAVLSALALPKLPPLDGAGPPLVAGRQDVIGFAAVLLAVAVGYVVTQQVFTPIAGRLLSPWLETSTMAASLKSRWIDLVALLMGLAFTLPLAAWAARVARFATLLGGLGAYFSQPGAAFFLVFIVLYKLGDAFAISLVTPFLLKGMAFSSAEVGVVNKVIGLWLTIAGALAGGALMFRLGLWRALLLFGVLQAASNLGFWWLAAGGKGAFGGLLLPALDWGFVAITAPTPVDGALLAAVAFENLSGGMGTAAHVAFQMSLCQQRFSATQYALLSAFGAVGRVWVGPLAGVTAESIGWPGFFLLSTWLAMPALLMLPWLRSAIQALDASPPGAVPD